MLLSGSDYRYTIISLSVILFIQLLFFFRFFSKIVYDLTKFLNSIRSNETSGQFSNYKTNSLLDNLHSEMNEVNQQIQELKINATKQYYYLQNIVDHIGMGIITVKENGRVDICNSAAKTLLELKTINSIDDIEKKITNSRLLLDNPEFGKSKLVQINAENNQKEIFIVISEFRLGDEMVKIMSFQNVTDELAKKEIDSWQKLIRIITHEITNSMGPIVSLAKTMSKYFNDKNSDNFLSGEKKIKINEKTRNGLEAIQETGEGMISFIRNYQELTRLPEAVKINVVVRDLFDKMKNLFNEEFIRNDINFSYEVYPEKFEIFCDPYQIEQILINMIRNSIQSKDDIQNLKIKLQSIELADGSACIKVFDNGEGITKDIIEDIFIPFYSTREDGSGIGLSLSRQIMRNHGGTISVVSEPEVQTTFTLKF